MGGSGRTTDTHMTDTAHPQVTDDSIGGMTRLSAHACGLAADVLPGIGRSSSAFAPVTHGIEEVIEHGPSRLERRDAGRVE
jgi:hypothetical protein